MDRYAEMVRELLGARGHQVDIIRPEPFFGRLSPSAQGVGKWLGYIDKYVLFPFVLLRRVRRSNGAVVHICDQANVVYTRWLRDVPHLITCHDVMAIQVARNLVPERRTGWTGRILQAWIFSSLRKVPSIVCVSPETRRDLLALAPELEDRIKTVESPLNYPYAPLPPDQAAALLADIEFSAPFHPARDSFLFHVGGNQWYKNREGLLRIYAQLCASSPAAVPKLVMAGKPPAESMVRYVEEAGLKEKVLFVTDVSNPQLCAFYSLAEVLVYPSLKEGFGWPLIEAQACGCPVITNNRPPMSRLAGPGGRLADPEDIVSFASVLRAFLFEENEVKRDRKLKALDHAKCFSREVFAKEMEAVYEVCG